MSDYPLTHPDEVDHLLRNAQLRDELEPFSDESMQTLNMRRVPTPIENEFLASMLAWERAPVLPISQWFTPELRLPPPETLDNKRLHELAVGNDPGLVRQADRARLHRSLVGSAIVSPDLSRHSSLAGEEDRGLAQLSCIGTAPGPATIRRSGCAITPPRKIAATGWKRTTLRCRRASLRRTLGNCRAGRCKGRSWPLRGCPDSARRFGGRASFPALFRREPVDEAQRAADARATRASALQRPDGPPSARQAGDPLRSERSSLSCVSMKSGRTVGRGW